MKAVYISQSRQTYGKASGIELLLEVDGREKKQFLMPFGDSKPVYEKVSTMTLNRGDHLEFTMQKTTRNGKDYWNPTSITKVDAPVSAPTASSGSGPSAHGAQFRSVEELNRLDCMRIASATIVNMIDKKTDPNTVADILIDIAVTLKNALDAEIFGFIMPTGDIEAPASQESEVPY